MKDYTAIGTVYSNVSRRFYNGLLAGGVSRAIKASVNDVCAVYARETTKDEDILRSEPNTQPQRRDNKENT